MDPKMIGLLLSLIIRTPSKNDSQFLETAMWSQPYLTKAKPLVTSQALQATSRLGLTLRLELQVAHLRRLPLRTSSQHPHPKLQYRLAQTQDVKDISVAMADWILLALKATGSAASCGRPLQLNMSLGEPKVGPTPVLPPK